MTNIHTCHFDCVRPDCVRAARENLFMARRLLADWQKFGSDVMPGCPAGQDWLDSLRARTEEALKP